MRNKSGKNPVIVSYFKNSRKVKIPMKTKKKKKKKRKHKQKVHKATGDHFEI